MKRNVHLQTEDAEEKPAFVSDSRTVNLAGGVPADKTAGFAPNNIKTAKYNLITFLPIFLFEMFSRAAYLYFLAQVRLCCTPLNAKHCFCCDILLCQRFVYHLTHGQLSQDLVGIRLCLSLHVLCRLADTRVAICACGPHTVLRRLACLGGVSFPPSQGLGPQQLWHLC